MLVSASSSTSFHMKILLDKKINGKFKMSTKLIQIYAEESLKVYQYMKMSFIKYDWYELEGIKKGTLILICRWSLIWIELYLNLFSPNWAAYKKRKYHTGNISTEMVWSALQFLSVWRYMTWTVIGNKVSIP